jgi:hypothetical protein
MSQKREAPPGVRPSDGAEITALSTHPKFARSVVPQEARTFCARFELLSAAARDRRLSRADLGALAVILGCVNIKSGRSFPSLTTIAKEAGVDLRSAPRSIARLADFGYITRVKGGPTRSTAYTWNCRSFIQTVRDTTDEIVTTDKIVSDKVPPLALTSLSPEPRDKSNQKKSNSATAGSRLPEEWFPSKELQAWAKSELPGIDLERVVADFVDYWTAIPGPRGKKLDWDKGFKNRVRQIADKAKDQQAAAPARYAPPKAPKERIFDRARAAAAQKETMTACERLLQVRSSDSTSEQSETENKYWHGRQDEVLEESTAPRAAAGGAS